MKKVVLIIMLAFPSISSAFEVGASASGGGLSVDFWSTRDVPNKLGFYGRFIYDFDDYEDGSIVSVCADGSISGSTGSGTCSGHGGVSRERLAEFSRYGLVAGPSYWVSNRIRLHGGFVVGVYNSDVNIGDESRLDFEEYGVDIGVSYSFRGAADSPRVVLSFESEQEQAFVGLTIPL